MGSALKGFMRQAGASRLSGNTGSMLAGSQIHSSMLENLGGDPVALKELLNAHT